MNAMAEPARPGLRTFTLYGFEGCPHCDRLKAHLDAHGVPYVWTDAPDPAMRQELYDIWELPQGARSMPQLFADEDRLGGAETVIRMDVQWLKDLAR